MNLNYQWEEIEPGAQVRIVGERGQFTFRKLDKNGDVEVYGGANGHLMFRTFSADRVRIKGKRRMKRGENV